MSSCADNEGDLINSARFKKVRQREVFFAILSQMERRLVEGREYLSFLHNKNVCVVLGQQ